MCYNNCRALNALQSLRGAAPGTRPAALHGRVVARLVWQSVQSLRASADVAAHGGVERSLLARHRPLREAAMASRRRRDRGGAGKTVLPPDPLQARRA